MAERQMMNARVDEDKVALIDHIADERDMSRSDFLRHLVDNVVESHESEDLREYADERGIDLITAQRQLAFEHFQQDVATETDQKQRNTQLPTQQLIPLLYGIAFVAANQYLGLSELFVQVAGDLLGWLAFAVLGTIIAVQMIVKMPLIRESLALAGGIVGDLDIFNSGGSPNNDDHDRADHIEDTPDTPNAQEAD
jgi:hypothetical protein